MFFGEERSIVLFAVYIWVAIGYGFRYGVPYLYLSILLSGVTFAAVIWSSDYWGGEAYPFALGVLASLLIIPLYATKLIGDLRAAMDRADTANAAKSRFLANMSHEMRTPLNGVIGFIDLIKKEELSGKVSGFVGYAEKSARNLLGIIDDVLDISKIEADEFVLSNEIFNLEATVIDTIETLRPLAEEKGLNLAVVIDPGLPDWVRGDRKRVGQIITNLVNNSIKFTLSGEVRFMVESRGSQDPVKVRFVVEDTGIGIPEDELEAIFAPFKQLDQGVDRRYGGTGLGLSIVNRIVQKMDGTISVTSETGEFTRTVVVLPMRPANGACAALETPEHPADNNGFDGMGLRALVVDDNEINREFLCTLLASMGFDSSPAANGLEALSRCGHIRYHIVFLDVHMANMDGVETTRRIRGMGLTNPPSIVAVTADVMGEREGWFDAADFDGFLTKPVDQPALLGLLQALLGNVDRTERAPEPDLTDNGPMVLDKERGIELASGNEELWRRGISGLLDSFPERINSMYSLLGENKPESIAEMAHGIVGSAMYVGAFRLADSAKDLEKIAMGSKSGEPVAAVTGLEVEFTRLRDAYISMDPLADPGPGDWSTVDS